MHPSIRNIMAASAGLAVLGGLAARAHAQEYCVTCTEPPAKYRCIVGNGGLASERNQRSQMLCITELARSGNHKSCSVGAVTSAPCEGDQRTVMFPDAPGNATPGAEPPPVAAVPPKPVYTPANGGGYTPENDDPDYADLPPDGAPGEGQPPHPGDGQQAQPAQPKTVEDYAKKTVEASGQGLKKAGKAVTDTAESAGNAVGKAAKKTWDCLSSLFGDC